MNTKVAIRDSKGKFIKGHSLIEGSEKGWFKKGVKSVNYKNGIWGYQKFNKGYCEDCNSKDDLQVHHLNKDRTNNNIENLKTVCRSCHWNYHKGKIPWNKGKKLGKLTEEHKRKIGEGVRKYYAI